MKWEITIIGDVEMRYCGMLRLLLCWIATMTLISCSPSASEYDKKLDDAERVMAYSRDSALVILEEMNPSDLKIDSLRAKYHYLKGYGHMASNRSMIGDSLISFAHNFFRGKDKEKDIRSGTAYAWYKFWVGDTPGALAMLDSIVALPNVPDSLMIPTLRIRALLGASEYQGRLNFETKLPHRLCISCTLLCANAPDTLKCTLMCAKNVMIDA